uniref:Uncharacterized protein n=1 Tax=Arundo donax TaxID=35708 RepID=A0A0A8Z324_ARUDO
MLKISAVKSLKATQKIRDSALLSQ